MQTAAPRRASARLMLQIGLGLLVSALFFWLAVRGVDWGRFLAQAAQMDLRYVGAYALVLSVAHFLRLLRWSMTIRVLAPVPWRRAMTVCAVGMLAIFALPARLGELVRPLLIIEGQRLNFGQATATVVVERLADGLVMSGVLFGTVLLLDASLVPPEFLISGYVAAAIFGGGSVGLVGAALTFQWTGAPLRRLLARFSEVLAARVLAVIEGFFGALRLLGRGPLALAYFALTVVIWALSGLGIALLFQATPEATGQLPLLAAFTTLSVIVVGVMIPAGPGTVGVFHWAVAFALQMFSVETSAGVLVATTLHLLVAAVNTLWGLLAWVSGDVSMPRLLGAQRPTTAAEEEPNP
jgi:uncharacterized protein (TIRG00374 family)